MSKFTRQIDNAQRLVAKNGQTMRLVRVRLSTYDPLNPDTSVPVVVGQSPVDGIVLPFSHTAVQLLRDHVDERVLQDPAKRHRLRYIILAGKNALFVPQADDVLITSEGPCRILGMTTLAPDGGDAILYYIGGTLDTHIDLTGLAIADILVTDRGALQLNP